MVVVVVVVKEIESNVVCVMLSVWFSVKGMGGVHACVCVCGSRKLVFVEGDAHRVISRRTTGWVMVLAVVSATTVEWTHTERQTYRQTPNAHTDVDDD